MNKVVIASAGSRKTTMLVEKAIELAPKKVLITTYTNENLDQIKKYFVEKCGCLPGHVTLLSWFGFLLQDGVKPYQISIIESSRVKSIFFEYLPYMARFTPRTNPVSYYLTTGGDIYRDRCSEFVCHCDNVSGGLVIKRLAKIYDHVFIDELQDLAGYDLDFLEKLFSSIIAVTAVGDPRQGTFVTNNSSKNKKFKKSGIIDWVNKHIKTGLIEVEEKNECFRCNQTICDFADSLFPKLPKTTSKNTTVTGHDGIFMIGKNDIFAYTEQHKPVVLRWDKRTDTLGLPAMNFGISKGRTFDRVLIFPTKPMMEFLVSRDLDKAGDLSKLYVAVTRARYSVAFVTK